MSLLPLHQQEYYSGEEVPLLRRSPRQQWKVLVAAVCVTCTLSALTGTAVARWQFVQMEARLQPQLLEMKAKLDVLSATGGSAAASSAKVTVAEVRAQEAHSSTGGAVPAAAPLEELEKIVMTEFPNVAKHLVEGPPKADVALDKELENYVLPFSILWGPWYCFWLQCPWAPVMQSVGSGDFWAGHWIALLLICLFILHIVFFFSTIAHVISKGCSKGCYCGEEQGKETKKDGSRIAPAAGAPAGRAGPRAQAPSASREKGGPGQGGSGRSAAAPDSQSPDTSCCTSWIMWIIVGPSKFFRTNDVMRQLIGQGSEEYHESAKNGNVYHVLGVIGPGACCFGSTCADMCATIPPTDKPAQRRHDSSEYRSDAYDEHRRRYGDTALPSYCAYVYMIFCVFFVFCTQIYVPNILLLGNHGWGGIFHGYDLVGFKRLDYFVEWHVDLPGLHWFNHFHRIWVAIPIIAIFQKFFLQVESYVRHEVNKSICLISAVCLGEVGYINSLKSKNCKRLWRAWACVLAILSCFVHVNAGFMLILFVGKSLTTLSFRDSEELIMLVMHVVGSMWVMEFAEKVMACLPLWKQWYNVSYYKDSKQGCRSKGVLSRPGPKLATKLVHMILYTLFRVMRNFALLFIVFVYVTDAKTGEHRGV